MMQDWLITGGCGFIGTNLIDYLRRIQPAANLRVLDNVSVGSKEDLAEVTTFTEMPVSTIKRNPLGIELIIGDLQDYDTCLASCEGIEVVVHLAASTGVAPSVEDPRKDMQANVIGTFNMLEASRQKRVKKFIFASSGATIGEVEPPIHEEQVPKPVSPYGASKLAGEAYCTAYGKTFGLATVILRFGNTYGPRSKHKNSVVAKFFRQALVGEPLVIYGDGRQTRDFIYIEDLIQAIMLSTRIESPGEVFQIATHKESTINEVARKIKELVERETGRQVTVVRGDKVIADVRRNFSDITKAQRVLGFRPRYYLDQGLEKTFSYFAANMRND